MIRNIYQRAHGVLSSATKVAEDCDYWNWANGAAVAANLAKQCSTSADLEDEKYSRHSGNNWSMLPLWRRLEAAEQSKVVITALPEPKHVTAAFSGDDGILAGLSRKHLVEHGDRLFDTEKFGSKWNQREDTQLNASHWRNADPSRGKDGDLVGAEDSVFVGEIETWSRYHLGFES